MRMSDRRPVELMLTAEEHPATAAWRSLGGHRMVPSAVEVVKAEKPGGKSSVYRLLHATQDGEPVIAKRYGLPVHRLERVMYEEVLPLLPVATPSYYGRVEEGDGQVWIFLEDAGSERLSAEDPEHRTLAAGWLATLHGTAAALPLATRLPDRGPRHYRERLDAGRRLILEHLGNPAFRPDEVELLGEIVAQCDMVEQRWHALEAICAAAPSTLVHGDFRSKNVFVRSPGGAARLLTVDWETSGWGVPAADLAPARHSDASHADLEVYCRIVQEWWPGFDRPLARRLAWVGLIFRQVAAIEWAAVSKVASRTKTVATHLEGLRVYHDGLRRALEAHAWERGAP